MSRRTVTVVLAACCSLAASARGAAQSADAAPPYFWPKYPPPTRTELAGERLGSYPFFQYTRTFQAGDVVEIAVDPTRFPSIGGQTADLWVVDAKTAAQWAANPALVDVTGGPTTHAFGSTSIQQNVFVAAAGSLPGTGGPGGTSWGRAYDVVIDVDQDGTLSSGDFIDGGWGPGDGAGFWVVSDPTQAGPLSVTVLNYSGGAFLGQRTFYPSNIAAMGQLPVVIVSHGNGHHYTWYDHIGNHLASWGYVVMSHENNTMPSSDAASLTTISNTDYLLANQAVIAGGVLDGHLDGSRLAFIGHSRGGEGVVRAYWRVANGVNTPANYTAADVILLSAIAPVTHITSGSTPESKPFHLLYGSSDDDVQGNPSTGSKPFAFVERATGEKHVTYLQGAGHGYFNTLSSCVCTGPNLLTQAQVHQVVRGTYLPLLEHHARANPAALDFLARMNDDFRPNGIDPAVVISSEHREPPGPDRIVLDDYESQPSTAVSSSGSAVSFDVSNVAEAALRDDDGSFAFSAGVPMNGMTRYKHAGDTGSGVVFDWSPGGTRFYEIAVPAAQQDLSDDLFLSFRAAQGTRHPETDALDAPLSFTVSLRDAGGTVSSIWIGNYGRLTRTYERTSYGAGAGWANEFATVRLRLTDFLTNASGLDLGAVEAVRFEFGAGFGSDRGRLALDDVEILR